MLRSRRRMPVETCLLTSLEDVMILRNKLDVLLENAKDF